MSYISIVTDVKASPLVMCICYTEAKKHILFAAHNEHNLSVCNVNKHANYTIQMCPNILAWYYLLLFLMKRITIPKLTHIIHLQV